MSLALYVECVGVKLVSSALRQLSPRKLGPILLEIEPGIESLFMEGFLIRSG